jgi:beta-lactamase regulating signal transducer with metallopeptidase domain/cytochrome c551/c552
MQPFILYLLKTSACLVPFYIMHLIFFRKLTFFRWNRFYLLATVIMSFIVPVIPAGNTIRPINHVNNPAGIVHIANASVIQLTAPALLKPSLSFDFWNIAGIIYFIGVIFTLFLLIRNLWKIYSCIRNNQRFRYANVWIVSTKNVVPISSFFNYLLIPKNRLNESEIAQVLAHESFHAKRLHSIDVILMEILKVIWWFNPVIYFYKRTIQEVHEYEVDKEVCSHYNRKNYARLLLYLNMSGKLTPVNLFSLYPLKDRIRMLFAKSSPQSRKWLYLMILPVTLIACRQLGSHKLESVHESNILVVKADYQSVSIDSTTSRQSIEQAAKWLQKNEGIDLQIFRYQKDSSGKIDLIALKANDNKTGEGGSALWNLQNKNITDFWKHYRIMVESGIDANGIPFIRVHSVPINNNKSFQIAKVAVPLVYQKGQSLFNSDCGACHNPTRNMIGPALAGVNDQHLKQWIYQFVRNSSALLASGDTSANKLYNKWNKIEMTHFPQLSHKDIDEIMDYVNYYAAASNH